MLSNDKTYKPLLTLTVKAAEDIPACRFIGFDGNICSENEKAVGVSQAACNEGGQAAVTAVGTAIVESDDAFDAGDKVTSDPNGKARGVEAEEEINGIVINGTAGAGFITVLLVS